ncbi:MAG: TonB-dependent receptor [Bacteroidetes bacterium]|nr:TonB-dependent receptor [Bacteroidota bacterium]
MKKYFLKPILSPSRKEGLLVALLFFMLPSLWEGTGMGLFAQWGGGGGNWKEMSEKMKVGHFYGKIVDSTNNKGVEFASVQLIGNVFDTTTKTMKKDVVVAGQLTEANGDFSLEKINVMGKFKLKIIAMGYALKEIAISFDVDMEKIKNGGMSMLSAMDKDLGNIKIRPQAKQLKEVEIVSTASVMELKLDKKVFNVEKNMISTGGTAEDVMKQVPSVSVDADGNVTMRNASPQIFVDGKPTTLTLDQIPADAIQSVEIISNPSAKYDASGGEGGILNIVLKKEKRMGYNGNIRAGIDQHLRFNGGADMNARDGKINAFISGNFNQRYSLTTGKTNRENLIGYPLTTISQTQNSITNGYFGMGRAGVDYFMNNRNTFTLSGNYMTGRFKPEDSLHTQTDTVYPVYTNFSSYNRISNTKRRFGNTGASFQYKHIFPREGEEWTADLNYNQSQFVWLGDYTSKYYDASGNSTGLNIFQNMSGNGYNKIFTGQTDLVLPLNSKDTSGKAKIETGIRGSYRDFLSKTDNFLKDDSTGDFNLIKNQSTHYKFIDQVYAGYVTYGMHKNKFSWQIGLRGESSSYIGELIDSNKTFKNIFPISLFPSCSSTYDLNGKDNFQFSYSRRINRPSFFQIIPFTDYSDSLNLKRGNPALKPEFTHSLELSYLKTINSSNNILATVYFKNTDGLITGYQTREYDSTLQRMAIVNTYENADQTYVYGAELTSKHGIKKWLDFTFNFNVYYSLMDAKNVEANLTNEQFSWFTKENFTFKLPKNFSIQLNPEYRSQASVPVSRGDTKYGGMSGFQSSPTSTAQGYIKARYSVDAAIKYEFMKNKAASLSVNIRDIFGTDINETVTNSAYFNQTTSRLRDPRLVRVNFSYRFGKFDTSIFKRKNMKVNTDGMEIGM